MATTTIETYYFPNKIGRLLLLSMEEILGRDGLNAVLNLSDLRHLVNSYPPNNMDLQFPFDSLSRMQIAMEDLEIRAWDEY